MQTHNRWILLALIVFLNPACAVYETWPGGSRSESSQPPAPVVRSGPVVDAAPERPAPIDVPVEVNKNQTPRAVASVAQPVGPAGFLLDEAERKRASGDLSGAATSIERAMRIQPGNPWLSLELATVRLEQGNPGQAELLAQRALAQSAGDVKLQNQCWALTASARQSAGDAQGAAVALSNVSQ